MPSVILTSLPLDAALTPSQALVVFALRVLGAGFVLWLLSVAIELVRATAGAQPTANESAAKPEASATSNSQQTVAPSTAAAASAPVWQPTYAAPAQATQGIDERTLAAIAVALELESAATSSVAHESTLGLSPWAQAGRARQMRQMRRR